MKADLSISNPTYWRAIQSGESTEGIPEHLYLWKEKEHGFVVPRHYKVPWTKQTSIKGIVIKGNRAKSFPRSVLHKVVPRDSVQINALNALKNIRKDKILALACGKGKTVVSLAAASEAQLLPLLVVVHTQELMEQWKKAIEKFLTTENGRPIKAIGHIQQGIYRWKGCPVAVGMLHTLAKRKYPKEFYGYWRLIIFDECHRLGTNHFIKVAPQFPCERWGLSATLKRQDNMDHVIQMHLGSVVFSDLEQKLKPKAVYFVPTGVAVPERKFIMRGGRWNTGMLCNVVSGVYRRNEQIKQWVHRAIRQGRCSLILGDRVKQLHKLHDEIPSSKNDKAVLVGSVKKKARQEALQKKTIFASTGLAKEGLDKPELDTLFILIPFADEGRLRQSIGRILREHKGKQDPVVIIFKDSISFYLRIIGRMKSNLNKLGFKFVDVPTHKAMMVRG